MTALPTSDADLKEGFRAFVAASRRLEQSYHALKARAEAIDLELAATVHRLEQALQEKETILGALPVGVLAVDAEGQLLWTNPEGARLQASMQEHDLELTELPDGESEHSGTCVSARRASLADGTTLLVVEDRTQVTALSREVTRLDRLAGLSELALGIAHEIKNPLNGVMGFAALMQRTEKESEIRRFADKIHAGLGQVDDIVREMLEFARSPERGEDYIPLSIIVERAAAAANLPSKSISVDGDTDVRVESSVLVRVLANLFRNSAEATPDSVRITVSVHTLDDRVELIVRDDGPGIDAAMGNRVFEPFVSSKDRGHGLGLALASRVMAFLGGRLELTNPGEPGATFCLTLPGHRREGGDE